MPRIRLAFGMTFALAVVAACGGVKPATDAAPAIDAPDTDAAVPVDAPPDAPPDAVDAPPRVSPQGQELNAASGRVNLVTGSNYSMEVQLGSPYGQQPIQGATYQIQGNTPIKP